MRVKSSLLLMLVFTVVFNTVSFGQYGVYNSRSILEKKVYYLDTEGRIGSCDFWAIHLGEYDCQANKEFPGEGTVLLDVNVNFSLLSSGYIEGKGYSDRGKTSVKGDFIIPDGTAAKEDTSTSDNTLSSSGKDYKVITVSDIDYVTNYGQTVKCHKGTEKKLMIKGGINTFNIKRLLMRKYNYEKKFQEVKYDSDVMIAAFSFTKDGIYRAKKALKK